MQTADGKLKVGVLALQGGYGRHMALLKKLGVHPIAVRTKADLATCQALILPGGESTAIRRHLDTENLVQPLVAFAKKHPLFGTCAGAILMSTKVADNSVEPLGLIDMTVERNAHGRQKDSFIAHTMLLGEKRPAFFIRAPKIVHVGSNVSVLATHKGSPILVHQPPNLFAATFHPELTQDTAVHAFFLHALTQRSFAYASA